MLLDRRPRIADVARLAGVSTATVDRVMNGRGGVRPGTVDRVEQVIREMARPLRPAAAPERRFDVVLAGDGSLVTRSLGAALAAEALACGRIAEISFVERMNPAALAARLDACIDAGSAGIAVQVLDHVLVAEALDRADRASIPVVTVLTDIAGVARLAYVGLDNRAAGRTAGLLMSRFCRRSGALAIVWGGQLYRSHEERESGFRNVLRAERPDLHCLEVITGNDDTAVTHAGVRAAIARHDDLVGVYCVGGGVTGVAEALAEAGLGRSVVMIGHNFNAQTKPYLLSGVIDAVIHQDTALIAGRAMRALVEGVAGGHEAGVPIDIVTCENMMHR